MKCYKCGHHIVTQNDNFEKDLQDMKIVIFEGGDVLCPKCNISLGNNLAVLAEASDIMKSMNKLFLGENSCTLPIYTALCLFKERLDKLYPEMEMLYNTNIFEATNDERFLEMSNYTDNIVKKVDE